MASSAAQINAADYIAESPTYMQDTGWDWLYGPSYAYSKAEYNSSAESAYNTKQNILDRQYEIDMSNTQYQRMVKDMEAAGLNPYMLYASSSAGNASSYASSAKQSNRISSSKSTNTSAINSILNSALKVALIVGLKALL